MVVRSPGLIVGGTCVEVVGGGWWAVGSGVVVAVEAMLARMCIPGKIATLLRKRSHAEHKT